MAFSTQRETSDGTLVLLDISIEYFDRSEIAVFFDGVLSTAWSWVGSTEKKISFSPAVPNGVEVMVVRSTDLSELRHMFSAGAAFTTQSLDEALLQILHIAQEARENATIEEVFHNLNMHGYRLINVGAGVDPTDGASIEQMQASNAESAASAASSAASALAAAESATEAEAWAGVAEAIVGLTIPVPVAMGGTGGTTQSEAHTALGLGSVALKTFGTSEGEIPALGVGGKFDSSLLPAPSGTALPSGGIIMWSGSVGSIPSGWVLCDGTASTPDLRGRFVIGAGGTYSVGATSDGSIPDHSHGAGTLTTNSTGAHTHSGIPDNSGNGPTSAVGYSGGLTASTSSAGTHSHSISGNTGSSGTGTKVIATYYALAYIMKT